MQLHEAKKGSKIKIVKNQHYLGSKPSNIDEQEILTYLDNDGMYSICIDQEGNKSHYPSWSKIEVIEEPKDL
tara:strand:+ start:77 stop:292 length:216 start_codon:yes stop_codon:yes gene_type:complete